MYKTTKMLSCAKRNKLPICKHQCEIHVQNLVNYKRAAAALISAFHYSNKDPQNRPPTICNVQ